MHSTVTFRDQLRVLGIRGLEVLPVLLDRVRRVCRLSLWLYQVLRQQFGMGIQTAALLAACFSLPGGVLRAVGGWLSGPLRRTRSPGG